MSADQVLFQLGDLPVTTVRFILALATWLAFAAAAVVVAAQLGRRLLWPGTAGGNTVRLLLNGFRVKMVVFGLLAFLAILGVRVLPLVYVLLTVGAILALSLRSTIAQIWAGLLILWERPFSLGERILVGQYEGEVERVGLRATTLRSEERMAIHVPNAYLTRHAIHNRSKTEGGFGLRIPVEVMTHCDSGEVISALRKAAERNNRVRSSPSPKAFMMGFTGRGLKFELRAWVDAYNDSLWATNELCRAIQSEFQRAGIQLVSEKPGTGRGAAASSSRSRARSASDREGDGGRGRDREWEAPRESRSERPRAERPPRHERRSPSRDAESAPRGRGGRRVPEPVSQERIEAAVPFSQPEPSAHVEVIEDVIPIMPEETVPAELPGRPEPPELPEPPEPPEPPELEDVRAAEPEPPETAPLEVTPPPEATAPEEAAPAFGRSKRKVPRR